LLQPRFHHSMRVINEFHAYQVKFIGLHKYLMQVQPQTHSPPPTKGQLFQQAVRDHFDPITNHFQIAATLTLKQSTWISKPIRNVKEDIKLNKVTVVKNCFHALDKQQFAPKVHFIKSKHQLMLEKILGNDYKAKATKFDYDSITNDELYNLINRNYETFSYKKHLNEENLDKTIKYFTRVLSKLLYGNTRLHKNKRDWAMPLILVSVEGRNSSKHTHLHLAIGNIPEDKLEKIEDHIRRAWYACDFANSRVCVKPVTDSAGWLSYITKEAGYTDNCVLDIRNSTFPPFIAQSICT